MVIERFGVEVFWCEDICVNVFGINYFIWVMEVFYCYIDLLFIFYEFSLYYGELGYELEGESWRDSVFCLVYCVVFDLFEMYSVIFVVGDRYLVEFFFGFYFKQFEVWKFYFIFVLFRK